MRTSMVCLVLATATLASAPPAAAAAAEAGANAHEKSLVPIPAGATLIAKTTVERLRGFAEMNSTDQGRKALSSQPIDTNGTDRVYQSGRSYGDTVAFFDDALTRDGFHVFARTVTNTATAWATRKPRHTVANVIVRDTSPVTFEIEEAASPWGIPLR